MLDMILVMAVTREDLQFTAEERGRCKEHCKPSDKQASDTKQGSIV